jgi:hypothetical protein
MNPHEDVVIPEGTSKEERAKLLRKARLKRYYLKNKNKEGYKQNAARANKNYYKKNKEKINNVSKAWAKEHKELVKERSQKKSKQYSQTYYQKNKEKVKESNKRWRHKNKETHKEINKRYKEARRQRDSMFVFKEKLRACVRSSFRRIKNNKFSDTQKLLGCSWEEAKVYIESLFIEGMSWENHGNGPGTWNIDHVRPVCTFEEHELHLMNRIQNLQPLWWEENNQKAGKWE